MIQKDLLIIGAGPAGVSTSLYAKRGGLDCAIITHSVSSLIKAEKIENFYGFESAISGEDLYNIGVNQAKNIGVDVLDDEVFSIGFDDMFTIDGKYNSYKAKSIVIATGAIRKTINIKNLQELEGKGVSYCAVCDGFFHRGKNVGVLGDGEYAIHEATALLPIVSKVTIFTNGKQSDILNDFANKNSDMVEIVTDKISQIDGVDVIQSVSTENSKKYDISGLFVALGVASASDLARKIGIETQKGKIVVDSKCMTNIDGIYAGGDCTAGLMQICRAVYDGAICATEVIKRLKNNN